MEPTKIFVNLPVNDLEKSKEFFGKLGYSFNPQFTDGKAACMVISETIYVMLLTRPFFATFTTKEIIDAHAQVETLLSLSCDSKEAVDAMVNKAVEAGGKPDKKEDLGFMYSWGFYDLDGHGWGVFYMNPEHVNKPQ